MADTPRVHTTPDAVVVDLPDALVLTPRCARELGRALLDAADHLTAPTTSDLPEVAR